MGINSCCNWRRVICIVHTHAVTNQPQLATFSGRGHIGLDHRPPYPCPRSFPFHPPRLPASLCPVCVLLLRNCLPLPACRCLPLCCRLDSTAAGIRRCVTGAPTPSPASEWTAASPPIYWLGRHVPIPYQRMRCNLCHTVLV